MEFDHEDVDKRVRTDDGTTVGTVEDVEDGTAVVDPSDDLSRLVRERLGWLGGSDTYDLHPTAVAAVTEEAVVLRGEYSVRESDSP